MAKTFTVPQVPGSKRSSKTRDYTHAVIYKFDDPPAYNPDGTEGSWDLRGFSVVHFDYRHEVRYVWAWQWVRT